MLQQGPSTIAETNSVKKNQKCRRVNRCTMSEEKTAQNNITYRSLNLEIDFLYFIFSFVSFFYCYRFVVLFLVCLCCCCGFLCDFFFNWINSVRNNGICREMIYICFEKTDINGKGSLDLKERDMPAVCLRTIVLFIYNEYWRYLYVY